MSNFLHLNNNVILNFKYSRFQLSRIIHNSFLLYSTNYQILTILTVRPYTHYNSETNHPRSVNAIRQEVYRAVISLHRWLVLGDSLATTTPVYLPCSFFLHAGCANACYLCFFWTICLYISVTLTLHI